ncbi:uncharacterized protein LOC110271230 [Arachis ipaensis]|uniref:uncharacterized protein LOC110271230 n=1 Tax=Arachis ipaensis TaxID=130454 RepID=UPI000A2B10F2|nr:uncharacterized protein LOC110271230 [Arachis ipaensis]
MKKRKKGGKRERESRGEQRSVREKSRGRSYIAITGLGLAAVHTPLRHHPAVSSPPPVAVVVTKGGERKRQMRGERERELARKLLPSKLGSSLPLESASLSNLLLSPRGSPSPLASSDLRRQTRLCHRHWKRKERTREENCRGAAVAAALLGSPSSCPRSCCVARALRRCC